MREVHLCSSVIEALVIGKWVFQAVFFFLIKGLSFTFCRKLTSNVSRSPTFCMATSIAVLEQKIWCLNGRTIYRMHVSGISVILELVCSLES